MWLLGLLLSCKQQEEQVETPEPKDFGVIASDYEVLNDADLDEYLSARYKSLQKQYGPSRIAGKGLLVDEGWCHDYFHYSYVISRLVGIDFVKLASIEAREGVKGVNSIVDRVPKSNPKYSELLRIRQLIDLTDTNRVRLSYKIFRKDRDPNLTDQEQIKIWIDNFKKGYQLRGGTNAPEEFLPEDFPKAHQISKLAGVDFQQLAFIELKGGTPALLLLIRTIPFWTHREKCFDVLQPASEDTPTD